jgi:carbon monoxide dehydrogenase subunit G
VELQHGFSVPVGIDEAWAVLLDIERIAPCMPGAALETVDGDDFTGSVKVRLGPIGLTYKGKARFTEKDETTHRAVIDAQGKDARGNGTASAKVTATLRPDEAGTRVDVTTDLAITGKPAQFGRGVMVDVGHKLIGQFADCVATQLAGGAPAAESDFTESPSTEPDAADDSTITPPAFAAPSTVSAESGAPPPRPRPEVEPLDQVQLLDQVEPIDLMASASPAVLMRVVPIAVLVGLLLVLWGRRRRRG